MIVGAVVRLLAVVAELLGRARAARAVGHDWIEVATVRRGVIEHDRRCRACGRWRHGDAWRDSEPCKRAP